MAGPGGGGGGHNSDNSMGPLWIVAALMVAALVIWYYFKAQLVYGVLWVKLYEGHFISLFTSKLQNDMSWIRYAMQVPEQVAIPDLLTHAENVGLLVSIPCGVVLFIFAFIVMNGTITLRFKNTYTMQRLIDEEQVNWPQISPITKLNLIEEDIDRGPWAMAINPKQYCYDNFLLREDPRDLSQGKVMTRDGRTMSINRGEATRLFTIQLGPYWRGPNALPAHTRAIFAALAARVNHDTEAAAKLFTQIAKSTKSGELNFSGADALLDKYINTRYVQQIIHEHAFVLTVMASMLNKSREEGVMATADFLWLKPVDRALWLMLSNTGRQTSFIEVAGPRAHWITEREIGRKLYVPMVEEAVNALEQTINSTLFPNEELENYLQKLKEREKAHG